MQELLPLVLCLFRVPACLPKSPCSLTLNLQLLNRELVTNRFHVLFLRQWGSGLLLAWAVVKVGREVWLPLGPGNGPITALSPHPPQED